MLKRLDITHKLAIVNALSALTVLAIAGLLLLYENQKQLQSVFEERIEREAALAGQTMTAAMLFQDWETAQELLQSLLTDPAVVLAQVADDRGQRRAHIQREDSIHEQSYRTENPADTDGGRIFSTSIDIVDAGETIGTLRVFAHNDEVPAAVAQALLTMLLLTLGALCVGLLLTIRLQSLVLSPISGLSQLVRRVRHEEDYTQRGTIIYPDEIGRLTADVNAMLDIIQARDTVLADRVAQRTSELERKNSELQSEITQRLESESALRESQAKFENAFNNAPIGMALVDNNRDLMQRNQVLNNLLGLSPHALIFIGDILAQSSAEDVIRGLEALDDARSTNFDCTVRCVAFDGSELTCVLSLSGVHDESGELLYSVLQLQDITEATQLSDELAYQATHDALTGLANRRVFESELSKANIEAAAAGNAFSLCLMDLDQFKVVNDTCGHVAGDALLKQLASTIRRAVRTDDLVVRLGGDEFAVLLYHCKEDAGLEIAETIRSSVEAMRFHWEGNAFRVGTSIGLLTIHETQQDLSDILRQADAACFAAKDLGRNRVYQVSSDDAQLARSQGEKHWVNRINTALEGEEFVLYAQPILPIAADVTTNGRVEILLRLRDFQDRRLIPPGAFLASAERYDLGTRVDRWVVQHLLKLLRTYTRLFAEQRVFWVNLSGQSLGDENFLSWLDAALRDADLPLGMINFEVTETAVVRNIDRAVDAMQRLKTFGCRFALDDFGTGLSSFGYLRNLPVDYIKIDGMFVRNIVSDEVDRMFVKSIIDIARVMNIETVAEFVENDEILKVLEELGVDYGQGFGLGRPEQLLPLPAVAGVASSRKASKAS